MDDVGAKRSNDAGVDGVQDDRGDKEDGSQDNACDGGAVEDVDHVDSGGGRSARGVEHEQGGGRKEDEIGQDGIGGQAAPLFLGNALDDSLDGEDDDDDDADQAGDDTDCSKDRTNGPINSCIASIEDGIIDVIGEIVVNVGLAKGERSSGGAHRGTDQEREHDTDKKGQAAGDEGDQVQDFLRFPGSRMRRRNHRFNILFLRFGGRNDSGRF